jgi:hypothetical protein
VVVDAGNMDELARVVETVVWKAGTVKDVELRDIVV